MVSFDTLHRQVAFGESAGRIIFQPRISCWYHDKLFAGETLPAPYTGMELVDIYRAICCSGRFYGEWNSCFLKHESPDVSVTRRSLNDTDTETTTTTPVGEQVAVDRATPNSPRSIRLKWDVTTEDELKVAIWRAENTIWSWDQQRYEQAVDNIGDLGAPTMYLPRVTIQDLYINLMGVENALYALYDWPDTVRAYFRALDDCHDRLIDVINACPIKIINFGDNLHCGTLPPNLFTEHVLGSYQRRCEKLHQAGKFVSSHWDGDTGSLLPLAKETGLDGIEAITPLPQGDVSLDEVKQALGDDLFLLDGIPAVLFDDTYPQEELERVTHQIIDLFAPKLILGISDEMSSTGSMDRVCVVRDLVDAYNCR